MMEFFFSKKRNKALIPLRGRVILSVAGILDPFLFPFSSFRGKNNTGTKYNGKRGHNLNRLTGIVILFSGLKPVAIRKTGVINRLMIERNSFDAWPWNGYRSNLIWGMYVININTRHYINYVIWLIAHIIWSTAHI
jgi:hypothetical protein